MPLMAIGPSRTALFAPLMEKAMAELKPEAAYFVADDG